jgi:RNA polymerase sigma factor (sigma-70 family)
LANARQGKILGAVPARENSVEAHRHAIEATDRLRVEVERGEQLDRRLAEDLGRPAPARLPATDDAESPAPRPGAHSQADEQRLVAAAQAGDLHARSELIEACLPRIAAMARTYRSGQVQQQELLQEGVVGVLRAVDRFDAARGVPFWGYATWWVRHAMQQLVSELTRPVVLSDRALRNLSRLKQAQYEAVQSAGHNPSPAELARRTGLELDQVEDLLSTERSPRALDAPTGHHDKDLGTFGDLLVDPLAEDAYEEALAAIEIEQLHRLLAGLSDREREVLRARYGLDGPEQTLREIGDRLGLSHERVRQIERRALTKLATAAGAPSIPTTPRPTRSAPGPASPPRRSA